MYAVICRSRGGFSANGKEENNASNDNLVLVNLTPFTRSKLRLLVVRFRSLLEWGTGKVSPEVVNTNFINLQYPAPLDNRRTFSPGDGAY